MLGNAMTSTELDTGLGSRRLPPSSAASGLAMTVKSDDLAGEPSADMRAHAISRPQESLSTNQVSSPSQEAFRAISLRDSPSLVRQDANPALQCSLRSAVVVSPQ